MLTFDLEKSLPIPVLTIGVLVVYYKRQLWTYNQGIHNCSNNKACMHMWDESTASRGSHEVGLCILAHIEEMETDATIIISPYTVMPVEVRTGTSIYLVCLWLHIVASSEYSFTNIARPLISGHSYLRNDRDFGHIELSKTMHISLSPKIGNT